MHVDTKDLPEVLQAALSSCGYGRKDIGIDIRETESMCANGGGDGYRNFVVLVNLSTGEKQTHMGSWGGPNMFNPKNAVDLDYTARPFPPGMAIIHGSQGGCRPVYARITLHPDNLLKLLPAKSELTERQVQVMRCIWGHTSSYRKECLARANVTPAEIDELVSLGLLAKNRAGAISVTTKGKNAREGVEGY